MYFLGGKKEKMRLFESILYMSLFSFQMQNLKLVLFNFTFESQKIEKEKGNANSRY